MYIYIYIYSMLLNVHKTIFTVINIFFLIVTMRDANLYVYFIIFCWNKRMSSMIEVCLLKLLSVDW